MSRYAPPIERLIRELARFPGIGEKTAARLANFILHESVEDARRLAGSIMEVKERIRLCRSCFNLTEEELCHVCADPARDRETVCVVQDPDALIAIESTGGYRGTYHVLHGVLAPLDGVGPDDLRLRELVARVAAGSIREVIIATNTDVQGEATALLINKLLAGRPVKISRIAMGVPMGGDLKYTDRMTLGKALEFRRGM
ncbi:MAG TPA: recombination mediator RecR [Syntrophales bacterium]|jgi:recombination protein RecR|nr:recombination mediator RecR [Syntrophales bacterium]HON23157.1 recombination mediator RecR [Syntrophales bacterium]HOU78160.1 recombination mediator RecR [Syntrophales bacterium]HPC33073.1 recombination mediator RecR [Syntrophales bacterium]HQG34496.1 recombination mediator RecR [Syntrophales bacterium]